MAVVYYLYYHENSKTGVVHFERFSYEKKKKKIGQNVIDKLTKWGKIGFFMEYFRTDFSQFSSAAVKVFILGGRMNTCL